MAIKLSKEIWKTVTDLTQSKLKANGLHYDFNPPKNDGSYVKFKGSSGMYFAFALTNSEVWVELELIPKKGQPQESVYNQIHANKSEIEKKLGYKIRWDNEDRKTQGKKEARGVFRIKSIMPFLLDDFGHGHSDKVEAFAERMVLFIQALSPLLAESDQLSGLNKKVSIPILQGVIPTKEEIEKILSGITPNGIEIDEEVLKIAVEHAFSSNGRTLTSNWWEIAKVNL